MITYRFTIYTDSVREQRIGAPTQASKREFTRDSRAAKDEVVREFRKALATTPPDGEAARAWLEMSDPKFGPTTIESVRRGEVTRREVSGQATAGTWVTEKGEKVIAVR